jgi:hypothetical protein
MCSVMHPLRSRKIIEQRILIAVNYFSFKGTVVIKYNSFIVICLLVCCFTFIYLVDLYVV